ncbi:helix-turn-helix domain-containing protein [Rhizobium sp. SSA_523]|uniref:helix-turn-helix domain-containing protein n=1 Tax=Rhizobium sp. SSA_523 TaxID=2952477 RepID=UPI0020918C94|nr:helix-turn-helix transcriptional regulator [Rhizobium sp. SSA_523]MCO5734630.1 helix-turn-helix transcriptional regulator [Rhizobium sp. SSA_523]WKC23403.1 helix-turn-helix transcriptional regulator [Rhizobium sp. SSA_523]
MTPFGEALRDLRREKGVTQQEMARAIGVSPAYLSALEHGRRGRPSFEFIQRVCGYFNIIWDEAEELLRLAEGSDPRVTVDTAGLPARYTALANLLARKIRHLEPDMVEDMIERLENTRNRG